MRNAEHDAERGRKRLAKLATGKIGRLLLEYSWPALVAMSLNALYAVVDRFYIGDDALGRQRHQVDDVHGGRLRGESRFRSDSYFQSIGKPMTAVVLSVLRQGVCMLPVIWILPYFMQNRTLAIWLSMPISDITCCLMTLVPFILHIRFLSAVRQKRLVRPGTSVENG